MARISRENHTRTVLDRRSEGGRCELHGGLGHEVHHRNKQGRVWTPSNCLRLCRGCHQWIEHHPEYAMALGLWVPREVEADSVPVWCRPILFQLGWWVPQEDGTWTMAGDLAQEVLYGYYGTRAIHAAQDALGAHLATVGALS